MTPYVFAAALALLLPIGGIVGFARKGSLPSLIAGCLLGSLYAFAWNRLEGGARAGSPTERTGLLVGTAASVLLLLAMGVRLIKTRKALPATLTAVGAVATYVFAKSL